MRSHNTIALLAATAAVASPEIANAKPKPKEPTPKVTYVAQVAMNQLDGSDNAQYTDRKHTGVSFEYVNADGTTTEVTVKSTGVKNDLPNPKKAWFVHLETFEAGVSPDDPGIAPIEELAVSMQDGQHTALKGAVDPMYPDVVNVTEASVHGVDRYTNRYTPGYAGINFHETSEPFQAGRQRGLQMIKSIGNNLVHTLRTLGQ